MLKKIIHGQARADPHLKNPFGDHALNMAAAAGAIVPWPSLVGWVHLRRMIRMGFYRWLEVEGSCAEIG